MIEKKPEEQEIREATQRLRQRDLALSKKCSEVKYTYWDADDLRLQLFNQYFLIKRPDGMEIAVTGSLKWKHPTCLTLRMD